MSPVESTFADPSGGGGAPVAVPHPTLFPEGTAQGPHREEEVPPIVLQLQEPVVRVERDGRLVLRVHLHGMGPDTLRRPERDPERVDEESRAHPEATEALIHR